MKLKKLTSKFVKNKTVLYRAPYDVGIKNGEIRDTSRIDATTPTLKFLLSQNCKIVIVTWVKRPKGKDKSLSTEPIAKVLSKNLKTKISFIDDCIGEKVESKIKSLKSKEILLLENTRFYKEDLTEDKSFARKLCKGCDVIVFDAFPQSHRKASSVTGILKVLPAVAGFYLENEVKELSKLIKNPKHPFTFIVGGAKISDKVMAIENLIKMCDYVLIGGGPSHIFLKAKSFDMAYSIMEDSYLDEKTGKKISSIDIAKKLLKNNEQKITLPHDFIIGNRQINPKSTKHLNLNEYKNIPAGWAALDIGPISAKAFENIILKSKTVFWAGPLGAFEDKRFMNGSSIIAKAMAENTKATTVACGGDTIDVLNELKLTKKLTHVSLAGGAALEFLAGKTLPALKLLVA